MYSIPHETCGDFVLYIAVHLQTAFYDTMATESNEHNDSKNPLAYIEKALHDIPHGLKVVPDQDGRGRGLAANKDFQEEEHVALYAEKPHPWQVGSHEDWIYMYGSQKEGLVYMGTREGAGPGCLVNDACSAKTMQALAKCTTVKDVSKWIMAYYMESKDCVQKNISNVHFKDTGKSMDMVAACPIAKGQPLLTVYDKDYWIEGMTLDAKAPSAARMACVAWTAWANHVPSILWSLLDDKYRMIFDPVHGKLLGSANAGSQVLVTWESMMHGWKGSQKPSAVELTEYLLQNDAANKLHDVWLTALGLPSGGLKQWIHCCQKAGWTKDLGEYDETALWSQLMSCSITKEDLCEARKHALDE